MLIANSKKQSLLEHNQQVSAVAEKLAEHVLSDMHFNHAEMFHLASRFSSKLHDPGKLDNGFQHYIQAETAYDIDIGEGKNFASENPLHHELSLLLMDVIWTQVEKTLPASIRQSKAKRELKKLIRYGIYWHHAEPVRDHELDQLLKQYFTDDERLAAFITTANTFLSELLGVDICFDENDLLDAIDNIKPPRFFDVSYQFKEDLSDWVNGFQQELDANLDALLIRFLTIYADRHVSSLAVDEMHQLPDLHTFNDDRLLAAIDTNIHQADLQGKRTEDQLAAAEEWADYDSNTIMGAAGCGKTRTALMAYAKARKDKESSHSGIIWVCPRIAIGLSVLDELKTSLPNATLSLLTGETREIWQGENRLDDESQTLQSMFDADIVITTVDQIAKWLVTNKDCVHFIEFVQRFVVFDEYHELFAIHSLYYISALLMRLKERQTHANLFISATPEPMHMRLICRRDASWQYPVILSSFNEQPVHLSFVDAFPEHEKEAIYIFNTATQAQRHALACWDTGREDIMCYHAKFKSEDKAQLTQAVLHTFGKHTPDHDATLFAGPIAQASLNISRRIENTEVTHPANALQRFGRSNRFAEYGSATIRVLVGEQQITEKKGKYGTYGTIKNTGTRKLLFKDGRVISHPNENYYRQYSYAFYQTLIKRLTGLDENPSSLVGCQLTTTLNQLNDFYRTFQLEHIERGGKLVVETKEFVADAIRYLDTVNLYKPTKLTIETAQGKEVRVSFRGGSLWATMCDVTVLPKLKIDEINHLIGLPEQREHLVTITESDCVDISLIDNLNSLSIPEFKALKNSVKYRARYSGRSQDSQLMYLAKSTAYPLVCSSPSYPKKTGLYYLQADNAKGKRLVIGVMRLKDGVHTLNLEGSSQKNNNGNK